MAINNNIVADVIMPKNFPDKKTPRIIANRSNKLRNPSVRMAIGILSYTVIFITKAYKRLLLFQSIDWDEAVGIRRPLSLSDPYDQRIDHTLRYILRSLAYPLKRS